MTFPAQRSQGARLSMQIKANNQTSTRQHKFSHMHLEHVSHDEARLLHHSIGGRKATSAADVSRDFRAPIYLWSLITAASEQQQQLLP